MDLEDPHMATISNLTHAANSVFLCVLNSQRETISCSCGNFSSPPLPLDLRRPAVALPEAPSPQNQDARSLHDDALDRHIEDVLDRKQKIKRTLQGVWAFVKTRVYSFPR
jgi:hypothetical protein